MRRATGYLASEAQTRKNMSKRCKKVIVQLLQFLPAQSLDPFDLKTFPRWKIATLIKRLMNMGWNSSHHHRNTP